MVRTCCEIVEAVNTTDFDKLPDSAIVLRSDAARVCGGQHPNTLARWSKRGDFPEPLRVGAQVGYRVGDLRAWLADLKPIRVVVVP